jgi:glycosyltransferase involved in cell wall biosynthesis
MTPRRFCFLTTFYPPVSFGGDALAVQRMARALAKRGYGVTVVHDADAYAVLAGDRQAPVITSPDPFGVEVVTLRSRFPLLSTFLTQQTGRPIVNGPRLRQLLEPGRFDVIVLNNVSLIGGPGLFALGRPAVKLYVAHEHWLVCPTHALWRHNRERCDRRECLRCQLSYRRPPQLWRFTGLLERQLAEVDAFIAMSEFSRAKHREFGFPREMEVLPPVLPDPDAASPPGAGRPHDRPYFLSVGRLERLKGLDELIAAFSGRAGADLLVVGDGTDRERLHRLARDHHRVRFLGRIASDDLGPYYRHALALVAPSRCFETFGLTLIEAFSHRTPVIARRLGPFPEIIEQSRGGLLFETTLELGGALRALETDPARREALGGAGYDAYRRHWSERVVIPRYLDVVERARARRHPEQQACARS